MAINPSVQLAPQVVPPSAAFPYGSTKNETAPGANDGTPYKAVRADDVFGLQQALLFMAGIVPSGNVDTALDKNSSQYVQAILHLITAAGTFADIGAADVYDLEAVEDNPAPAGYRDNMVVFFTAANSNTGASTVDVEGLGVKDIFLNGVALVAGAIIAGTRQEIIFDLANDRFNLIKVGDVLGSVSAIDLTLSGAAASPPDPNTLVKDNIPKGWISFNGTGVIAVNSSYNVSSIVDNGTGNYTINWDTDFADVDYSVVPSIKRDSTGGNILGGVTIDNVAANPAVGAVTVQCERTNISSDIDAEGVYVQAFGNQ